LGFNENKGVAPAVVLAAWEGELEVLRLLLQNGANPNVPAPAESALYTAIEHTSQDESEPNRVSLLLDAGAVHDFFTAAMWGRTDLVEQFLGDYPELISRRSLKRNRSPLEEAVSCGRWETAEFLAGRGATIAIHAASAMGRIDLMLDILEADHSQLESGDDSQQTPIFIAAMNGRAEAMEFLLQKGGGGEDRESMAANGAALRCCKWRCANRGIAARSRSRCSTDGSLGKDGIRDC